MALPAVYNTIVVYDDLIDALGRPVLGSGTASGHKTRRVIATGLMILPVPLPFDITSSSQTLGGETLTVGHWELVVPLSVDADITNPDPYTFHFTLAPAGLIATLPDVTVLLTADMGPRIRLSDIAPDLSVDTVTSTGTVSGFGVSVATDGTGLITGLTA